MAKAVGDLKKVCYENFDIQEKLRQNLCIIYQELSSEIHDLDLQLNHIAPMHRNRLKDEKNISIRDFLMENYVKTGVIAEQLREKSIQCRVEGENFYVKMSEGNSMVIFDNIVLNSQYWLDKFSVSEPVIYFELSNAERQSVTIWDNGRGIDSLIENVLFEPFKSQKELGRGLGLYIVQELLALSGASIELLPERNDYGNRYKFRIEFWGDANDKA